MKYTLVQHSAASLGTPGFRAAVENAAIATAAQEAKIRKAGGLVFDTYEASSDAEYAENYPPGVEGMYPRVRGRFAKVGPLRVYIPAKAS